jgi:ABC-type multidrug transport system permease subunit
MLRGFGAIFYKEFIVIFRDRAALFFMFFPPLIQIIAYGYALDTDVKNMSMMVMNEDRTVESRRLIDRFVNTKTFRLEGEVHSVNDLTAAIRSGRAHVGLQIPPDYSRKLQTGETAQLQVLIDGSNSTTALKALNTALAMGFLDSIGEFVGLSGRRNLPVEVRPQILYNPALRAPNFYVPGMIGMSLQIATLFATAMAIVRERERGTLEQLIVSPLSRWGLMLGKLVPYLIISMGMAGLLFAIMHWLFFVPIRGTMTALFASTLSYVFAMLSLGLLVSTWAETHMQAFQATLGLVLPSIFFSGFIFPREPMPTIFYALGAILPSTYFVELMRAIILRGAGFQDFWLYLVILTGMGILLFAACLSRFRKSIA